MALADPTYEEVDTDDFANGDTYLAPTWQDTEAGEPTGSTGIAIAESVSVRRSEVDVGPAKITPPAIPIIPFPLAKKAVSGRYRGTLGSFQIELRVDVDRN